MYERRGVPYTLLGTPPQKSSSHAALSIELSVIKVDWSAAGTACGFEPGTPN